MTLEQRVAVLEEIFLKLQDYYMSNYSGEEIDALLASAGVPIGITKEYDSVSAMNSDFSGTDVTRGQFVLILPSDTSSEDYGKVYLKGSANWVYVFTLTSLTAIKGPQGPAGANGATGATGQPGKNFAVLGYYETLSALNAAVPSPEAGDTYGIGTEPPYAYYMYDPTISNWRYVGNLQGPAGSQGEKGDKGDKGDTGATGPQGPEGPAGGASNFVRYDAAQTLTDEQKAQAQGNIGAAPDGYGLGAAAVTLTASDDLDNVSGNGWYSWGSSIPANTPTLINAESSPVWCSMLVINSTQIVCSGNDRNNVAMRTKNNAGWTPWEYVNPALKPNVSYRTTERYLGNYCTRLVGTDGIEYWSSPAMPYWHSAGKAIAYEIAAGENITVPLSSNRTYFLACCDNVRKGLVAVQTAGNSVFAITPIITLDSWSVTLGTGLTVIVTETDGRYQMRVAMTCLY